MVVVAVAVGVVHRHHINISIIIHHLQKCGEVGIDEGGDLVHLEMLVVVVVVGKERGIEATHLLLLLAAVVVVMVLHGIESERDLHVRRVAVEGVGSAVDLDLLGREMRRREGRHQEGGEVMIFIF